MRKIVVFANTANHKKLSGPAILDFAHGIDEDVTVVSHDNAPMPEADIAVMYGFYPAHVPMSTGLKAYRKTIRDTYQNLIVMDGGCFRSFGNNIYWRLGYNSPLWDGDYRIKKPHSKRWKIVRNSIREHTGTDFRLHPWKTDGDYILVCLQTNTGWSMAGMNTEAWITIKLKQIREVTDMPVVIRLHPRSKQSHVDYIENNITGVTIQRYEDCSALEAMEHARAVVTYNSSIACDSVMMGVPTFIDEGRCLAAPCCNHDIRNLLEPDYTDRQPWLNKIAYTMWDNTELSDGTAWNHLRR